MILFLKLSFVMQKKLIMWTVVFRRMIYKIILYYVDLDVLARYRHNLKTKYINV